MKLSEEVKEEIRREAREYLTQINETSEYGSLSKEQRDELGAFFTPPDLTIQMLEMFDCDLEGPEADKSQYFVGKDILDPTCGSGNLIMGALIAGLSASKDYPEHVFGNELSSVTLDICRKRFTDYCQKLGLSKYDRDFWNWHIHQGDALKGECISRDSFTKNYTFRKPEINLFTYNRLSAEEKALYKKDKGRWVLKDK